MEPRVVVWDPEGRYREGEVVDGQKAELLTYSKAATLPVEPGLMARNGAGGWVKRAWGCGVGFDPAVQRRGCGVAFYAVPGYGMIHWVARVAAMPSGPGARVAGTLRLNSDTSQTGTVTAGLGRDTPPIELAELGEPDQLEGWTITGRSRLSMPTEGFIGLGLYGTMVGGLVRWLAVSQSR